MTRMPNIASGAITEAIRSEIKRSPNRAIPFRDYMELCLYHDPHGYYNRSEAKVGKDGDFYTSVSIGTIMGEILGAYLVRLASRFEGDRPPKIAEWGGGTGRLSRLVLDTIRKRAPDWYDRLDYVMVERSPYHRMRQLEELGEHRCVRFAGPDDWLSEADGSPLLVFSNELLDAFPVHRIERKDGKLLEWYVGWDESGSCFRTELLPLDPDGAAAAYMQRERITIREGQWIEANPAASDWIGRVGAAIERGALVTIDYGDVAEELYAAHRMRGTFLCYRNHQASDDPYAYPGEQDMTSHVNFTACLRAGREAGVQADSLRTQKQFLLDEGVLELLVAHSGTDPFGPEARRNRAVRQLLLGDSMSELFKVLVQTK